MFRQGDTSILCSFDEFMRANTWGILYSLIFLLSSCSSVYMPNVPNSPMLSASGELHASGHITPKGNVSFNTAYAVSDHFGVLVNGSVMNRNRLKKDFRHNLIEIGGGYFNTFGPDSNLRVFEIYTGLGKGSSDRIYKEETNGGFVTYDRQEVTFEKFFVQVNYSSKEKKSLNLFKKSFPLNYGTVLRMSYVSMDEFIRNDLEQPTEANLFLEPVFFTRMVLSPSVQFQFTSGSNFGLMNRKFMTAGNSVFSLGVVINVGGGLF